MSVLSFIIDSSIKPMQLRGACLVRLGRVLLITLLEMSSFVSGVFLHPFSSRALAPLLVATR